jgi:hypothetical protein
MTDIISQRGEHPYPETEIPRCHARHPETGLQCARVVPPHTGWAHIAGDASEWDDEPA